jgi:acetyl-CoA acetyltransferase
VVLLLCKSASTSLALLIVCMTANTLFSSGHPLGNTGSRQVSTLLYELKRTDKRVGVTSMCVGGGMGMAAVWVAE